MLETLGYDRASLRNRQRLEFPVGGAKVQGMIEVKHASGDEWVVTVKSSDTTRHRVRVSKADVERLAGGQTAEKLIAESFRFLLEREPNTSILSSFDLPLIGRYFPEFDREIKVRMQQTA